MTLLAAAPGILTTFSVPAGWKLVEDKANPVGYDRVWKRSDSTLSLFVRTAPILANTTERGVREALTDQNKYGMSVVTIESVRRDNRCSHTTAAWVVKYRTVIPPSENVDYLAVLQNTKTSGIVLRYGHPLGSSGDGAITNALLAYCAP